MKNSYSTLSDLHRLDEILSNASQLNLGLGHTQYSLDFNFIFVHSYFHVFLLAIISGNRRIQDDGKSKCIQLVDFGNTITSHLDDIRHISKNFTLMDKLAVPVVLNEPNIL